MKYELVSFALCPYVQRSAITMKWKKVPFTFKEIDLQNPPEWFNKISPLGKVPVLVIDGKTTLFESAVINEYIDEVTEPRLMPTDPLQKAIERGWIEVGSELLGMQYTLCFETEADAMAEGIKDFFETLEKLEPVLKSGPYFRGKDFSLVDSTFAPFFLRTKLLKSLWNDSAWAAIPKTRKWAETLIGLPEVQTSVKPTFAQDYTEFLRARESALD